MELRIKSFEEYKEKYEESITNPDGFWDGIAQTFHWQKPYDTVCEWEFESPNVKWFLNVV